MKKSHKKSIKLSENININNILTYYSKQKYKNEMKEVKEMIQKQKKKNILKNDYSNNNKDLCSLFSSVSKKSSIEKTKKIIQLVPNSFHITNKKHSKNPLNNYITIDVHKIL